jgi:hypothetical protein
MKNISFKKAKSAAKPEQEITRKEALKKAGKYAAFTAASMILLLTPKKALATSPGGFGDW